MTKWKCQNCGQEFSQPLAVRRCMIGYDGKEHWEDGYTCLCPDCQSSNISGKDKDTKDKPVTN